MLLIANLKVCYYLLSLALNLEQIKPKYLHLAMR